MMNTPTSPPLTDMEKPSGLIQPVQFCGNITKYLPKLIICTTFDFESGNSLCLLIAITAATFLFLSVPLAHSCINDVIDNENMEYTKRYSEIILDKIVSILYVKILSTLKNTVAQCESLVALIIFHFNIDLTLITTILETILTTMPINIKKAIVIVIICHGDKGCINFKNRVSHLKSACGTIN